MALPNLARIALLALIAISTVAACAELRLPPSVSRDTSEVALIATAASGTNGAPDDSSAGQDDSATPWIIWDFPYIAAATLLRMAEFAIYLVFKILLPDDPSV